MSSELDRVRMLLASGRFDLAETEARRVLSEQPDRAESHFGLAMCLLDSDRNGEAADAARQGLAIDPEDWLGYYLLAYARCDQQRFRDAQEMLDEAISLAPEIPNQWALQSRIHFDQRRFADALAAADHGLTLDPNRADLLAARAQCLTYLGRTEDAQAAIAVGLATNPGHASSHEVEAWAFMHRGEFDAAAGEFVEVLRLDPARRSARRGLVLALKGRHRAYAPVLRGLLWASREGNPVKVTTLVLAFAVARGVGSQVTLNDPATRPWLLALALAVYLALLLAWLADPVFNLVLRLDPIGRHALSDDQRRIGDLLVASILATVVCALLGLVTGRATLLLATAVVAVQAVPLTLIPRVRRGWPRQIITCLAGALSLLCVIGVIVATVEPNSNPGTFHPDPAVPFFGVAMLGVIVTFVLVPRIVTQWGEPKHQR